jgi:hypothetical protein
MASYHRPSARMTSQNSVKYSGSRIGAAISRTACSFIGVQAPLAPSFHQQSVAST